MKRVDSLHIVQVRIFRNDEFFLSDLRLENSISEIKRRFSFKQALPLESPASADPQGAIAFMSGEVEDQDRAYEIERLIIESRRVIISAASSSSIATKFFEALRPVVIELDRREKKSAYEPLVMTEETTTVVHLDFPITSLFASEKFKGLMSGFTSLSSECGAKATIIPSSLHFRVSYRNLPEPLTKNNIALLDKDIAIELRVNTDVEENAYFITSPLSTDSHLKLISLIEDSFREVI